jgi:hypothetical protein
MAKLARKSRSTMSEEEEEEEAARAGVAAGRVGVWACGREQQPCGEGLYVIARAGGSRRPGASGRGAHPPRRRAPQPRRR